MTREEIIEKIRNKLLENALAEYRCKLEECFDVAATDRSKYQNEYRRLSEERYYLMQDYDDIVHGNR